MLFLLLCCYRMVQKILRLQFLEKWANLRLPLIVQKPKVLQLLGALPSWLSDQELEICPWTLLWALPPLPCSPWHGAVPPRYCGLEPPLHAWAPATRKARSPRSCYNESLEQRPPLMSWNADSASKERGRDERRKGEVERGRETTPPPN